MNWPFLRALGPRWRRFVQWGVGLLLAYTIVGFLVLPPIIRVVAVRQLAHQLDREVSIRSIRLNPFVLSATVRELLIKDKDGEAFISWDEVYANFQLVSFLGHPWVFKEFSASKPFLRVEMKKDYTLNFSDLITKFSSNRPAEAPAKPVQPLALRIDKVTITGARAALTDWTPRTPFKRLIGPLDLNLTEFRTDPGSKNPYSFMGTTDAGEKFAWAGTFSLAPIRSEGDFSVEKVALKGFAPLYQDLVRFEIKDGTVDMRSSYRFELSAADRVAIVTNTSFALHNFKLSEPGSEANVAEVPELAVSGASVDAMVRKGMVSSVGVSGAKLWLRRNQDNSVNVVELAKPAAGATNAPGAILLLLRSITNTVAMFLNSTNAWQGAIDDVRCQDCALRLEDMANARPVRLDLDQVNLSAEHISNSSGTNLSASLSLRWNTNGSIKTGLQASFAPMSADLDLAFRGIDLHPLDPYLDSKLDVFILGSKLGLDGRVKMRETNGALPDVTFEGNARLDDFATVDGVLGEDLLKWRSVRVTGIKANLNPEVVSIQEVAVDDASARVVIETNRTINLLAAMRMTSTNTVVPEKAAGKKKLSGPKQEAMARTTPETNSPELQSLPRISIASVVVSNAQVHFTDRSLSPAVDWSVDQAGGTITGLSSEEMGHAEVNFRAKVENVGPVQITGTINPLSKSQTNDLKISVQDVDLTPTSPYVGKFAGYELAEGKLGMKLDYHLVGRKVQAKNLIELDQFTFGPKVNSPDATKLPVRLAVAILKDREGKIQLDVPVEGSLDDPTFRLHKVIMRAIGNILTKIATSPFSVLGAVFGGKGEELSFLDFEPGSAALEMSSTNKLEGLSKGLYARPALQLEIEGSVDASADREGLRRVKLQRRLQLQQWLSLRQSQRATISPDQIALTPEERMRWIKQLYADAMSKGEIKPASAESSSGNAPRESPGRAVVPAGETGNVTRAPRTIGGGESEKGASLLIEKTVPAALAATPQVSTTNSVSAADPFEVALLNNIAVTEDDFRSLATDRAKAARDYLLQTGKVENQRLFIAEKPSAGAKTQGSRVYLQLR